MEVAMADVEVSFVSVQVDVGMRDGASLVFVQVVMRVHMRGTVTVRVDVHCVGVVIVNGPIRVWKISVILIPRICVIAMVVVQMIYVGHIEVVVVRDGIVLVVVIAMAHIPVVRVRRLLRRAIQMARAGEIGMIGVGGCVGVIRMERIIGVIGMPGVGVIIEPEIAMDVVVIAMVAVGVAMNVDMRRRVCMVAVRRGVRVRDVAVGRRVRVRGVGVRPIDVVRVRIVAVRCVRMRRVSVVVVVLVRRDRRIQVDVQMLNDVVPMRCIAMHVVMGSWCLR